VTAPASQPQGYPSDETSKSKAQAEAERAPSGIEHLEQSTIDRAIDALNPKQGEHNHFFNYYNGTAVVPLVSERLQEIYRK
jgi:hypothetical protein